MTEIDIGTAAIDRSGNVISTATKISVENPANADGIIDTIEVFGYSTLGEFKVGTFFGSDTYYACRDYVTIGTVESGSKQTFSGLEIDVVAGDLLGDIYTSGAMERDSSGDGYFYKLGDNFGGEGRYSFSADKTLSRCGTGETAAAGVALFGGTWGMITK